MLMSPNKGETPPVHGCQCPRDMAVRMCEVLTRPWVGVCVPLALSLSHINEPFWSGYVGLLLRSFLIRSLKQCL